VGKNIVLVPGILGFSRINGLEYFNGVPGHLKKAFPGIHVLPATTAPLGTVARRADRLARQIAEALDAGTLDRSQPLHILAHSMGGLDARFLVHGNLRDLRPRIVTITTIGTPHFGSPVASFFDRVNPLECPWLGPLRENANAVHDLSEEAARTFNEDVPDEPGIQYSEVAGIGRKGLRRTSLFFQLTFQLMKAKATENDGVVPFDSATRKRNPAARWPGDHADLIGHNLDHPGGAPAFPHLEAYADLVRSLI
jgi:triacylglycerol lipase